MASLDARSAQQESLLCRQPNDAATQAYQQALRAGVPAAARKVFLDDTPTREAIAKQLDIAARDAPRDGSAIAIGHPHPRRSRHLPKNCPRLESRGIRLVFVSDLVRYARKRDVNFVDAQRFGGRISADESKLA